MTAESTPTASRSRRALLAGAIGGLGVWAAAAFGRAAPAEAAAGDPIRMGRLNRASSTATTLQTKTSGAAMLVNQLGGGPAVKGVATTGRGVMGVAGADGTGVWAYSPNHYGVHARSDRGTAIYGETPFDGFAGEFVGPIAVYGYQDVNRISTPAAPNPFQARIFVRQNDGGKHELCVRFPTGAVQVIATEP